MKRKWDKGCMRNVIYFSALQEKVIQRFTKKLYFRSRIISMYFFYLWSFSCTKDRRNIKFNTSLINAHNSNPISVQIYSKMQLEQVCNEKNIHVSKSADIFQRRDWGSSRRNWLFLIISQKITNLLRFHSSILGDGVAGRGTYFKPSLWTRHYKWSSQVSRLTVIRNI